MKERARAGAHEPSPHVTGGGWLRGEAAVSSWNAFFWGPLCYGLTAIGLVLSFFLWRRHGPRRGTRAAAWSLIPLAAYLTGAILLIYRIISAIVRFAGSFVFSPTRWAGLILFALAAALFLVSGGLPSRKKRVRRQQEGRAVPAAGGPPAPVSAAKKQGKPARQAGPADDGLDDDVQQILRRRGIN